MIRRQEQAEAEPPASSRRGSRKQNGPRLTSQTQQESFRTKWGGMLLGQPHDRNTGAQLSLRLVRQLFPFPSFDSRALLVGGNDGNGGACRRAEREKMSNKQLAQRDQMHRDNDAQALQLLAHTTFCESKPNNGFILAQQRRANLWFNGSRMKGQVTPGSLAFETDSHQRPQHTPWKVLGAELTQTLVF